MKTNHRISVVLTILLCTMLACLMLPLTVKASGGDFTAELKAGYDNKTEIGKYAPFTITIENNGSDFSGRLQLIVGNKVDYNIMYETDFSIARGEKKSAVFACKVVDNLGKANIRIVDKKDRVIWSEEKRYSVDNSALQKIDIGILSDDFAALGYMDGLSFSGNGTVFKSNLTEMKADTFPEDVNALDMLEVIVITNFSTDILTDEQTEALNLWVTRGGLLIVGTGSNSSKTLSKLNGYFFDVKPDKMERRQTSFGLNNYGSRSAPAAPVNNTNPRDDQEFMGYYDEMFYNYRQDVDAECLEDFMFSNGLTEEDLNEDGTLPEYFEEGYYDFCLDYYYMVYTFYSLGQGTTTVYMYNEVMADVLDIKVDKNTETIMGDSPVGDYVLATIFPRAKGYVALYGIDFTMNPVPAYADAGEIIRYPIERYIFQEVQSRYDSASSSYNGYSYNLGSSGMGDTYEDRQFLEKIASAPLPPMILYVVPILAYIVAILVLYLVNRKKKKTFRLWIWYPLMAIGVAVLIYSIGFSTRIIRPRFSVATVLELNKPSALEKNYVAVTTPSNRTCEVSFSDEYDIQLIRQINKYFYDNSDKVNMDSYRVAFRREVDRMNVRFAGNVALSSDQFLLESIRPDTKEFEAKYVTNANHPEALAENLILTNKTGQDLENAFVVCFDTSSGGYGYWDGLVYRIGDWKSGDEKDLTAMHWIIEDNYGYSVDNVVFDNGSSSKIGGFFLGSLSEPFATYIQRKNLAAYLKDYYTDEVKNTPDMDPNQIIFVMGFPKEGCCKDIQFGDKYRVERTELLSQRITLEEMKFVEKQ